MTTFEIKQGDRFPRFEATLKDDAGAAVNLDGATVQLLIARWNETIPFLDTDADVIQVGDGSDGSKGKIAYDWEADDTLLAGELRAVAKVTFSGETSPQSFPTSGFVPVLIGPNLADALP